MPELMDDLRDQLAARTGYYDVCGIIDRERRIYPLGSDTKVLSTIFELISRPVIFKLAMERHYDVVEAEKQNHYPDFTLMRDADDLKKLAIDVKTTYRRRNGAFHYTLGSYTSFIRKETSGKNIVFPFNQYAEHWVIGFVYDRMETKKASAAHIFNVEQLSGIPLAFSNVEFFVQEKWNIKRPGW